MPAKTVRSLTACAICGELADRLQLVPVKSQHAHGRCYANAFGEDALLALPQVHLDHLLMSDVGCALMAKIVGRAA